MTREFEFFGLAVVKNGSVCRDLLYRVNLELITG